MFLLEFIGDKLTKLYSIPHNKITPLRYLTIHVFVIFTVEKLESNSTNVIYIFNGALSHTCTMRYSTATICVYNVDTNKQ